MKLSLFMPKMLISKIGRYRVIKTYILVLMLEKIKFTKKQIKKPIIASKMAVEYSIKPNSLGLKLQFLGNTKCIKFLSIYLKLDKFACIVVEIPPNKSFMYELAFVKANIIPIYKSLDIRVS